MDSRDPGNASQAADVLASERALNSAILAGDITRGYEIFDHFYAKDVQANAETLKEPVLGKAAVRPAWRVSWFLFTCLQKLVAFRYRLVTGPSLGIAGMRRTACGRWSFMALRARVAG